MSRLSEIAGELNKWDVKYSLGRSQLGVWCPDGRIVWIRLSATMTNGDVVERARAISRTKPGELP